MPEPETDASQAQDLADPPRGQPPDERRRRVPYAQMDAEKKEREAPGPDEHEAAGQGLSG